MRTKSKKRGNISNLESMTKKGLQKFWRMTRHISWEKSHENEIFLQSKKFSEMGGKCSIVSEGMEAAASHPVSTLYTIHHSRLNPTVLLPDSGSRTSAYRFFGYAPVNKLVPAISLLWAL